MDSGDRKGGADVVHSGKQDIGWSNHPYESTTILEREVSLFEEDKDVLLEKGEHTFGFQILVPSATAPYERCQHGRVRHTVTAKAKGIGAMGGDVVSSPKILFLVVNVSVPLSKSCRGLLTTLLRGSREEQERAALRRRSTTRLRV